jgi:hypothetical protein
MYDLENVINEMVEAQKAVLEKDEIFELGAKTCRKCYDALLNIGFTEDQAIRIIAGGGMNFKK